jgi:hypothetical protein
LRHKKFIHAKPDSGRPLALPQAKPMKISPKYGSARLRMSTTGELLFLHWWPGRKIGRINCRNG